MGFDIDFGALQQPNPFAAYQQGQEVATKRRQAQARQAAGNVFATDPDQAAQILASSGDLGGAAEIQKIGASRKAAASRSKAATLYAGGDVAGAQNEALASGDSEFLASIKGLSDEQKAAAKERAHNIANVGYGLSKLPYEQRKEKLAYIAAHPETATALNLKPEDITSFDPTDENIRTVVTQSLGLANAINLEKPTEIDPTKNLYVSDLAGGGASPAPQGQAPTAQPAAQSQPATDGVFGSLITQESGGRPGVLGPQTQYGRAEGLTQMLPATAQGVAQKLGVAWRPELMTGTTPEAAQYQTQLGKAYFEEGLQKYGGNVEKALMYYHGGPDEAQWGPKTHAYAQAVLGRVQGDAQPYQVASNGPTPPPPSIPGYHMVQQGQPKPEKKTRPATAQEKAAYGVPADVPAQIRADGSIDVISGVAARAKPIPAKISQGYAENNTAIQQIDKAIELLAKNPNALGVANIFGDGLRQRFDPNGVETRAKVANIGAVKLHDLSGAAITAAETPRLKPFIPMPTDTAEAATVKLRQLREQLVNNNSQIEVQYGEDSGYSPLRGASPTMGKASPAASANGGSGKAPVRVNTPQDAMRLAPGTVFITPDGRRKVR